ncbi:hypothetical protein ON05_034235 (plasmid) [Acaryochloris sp. CCMEE 5410]|nr:hypothetical protein ON05_034235 [Acaryochloris sp. CCMEE 5410]
MGLDVTGLPWRERGTFRVHILTNFATPLEGNLAGRMAVTSPPLWKLSSPVKWQ